MRLAWLNKLPTTGVPVRGEGAATLLTETLPKDSPWVGNPMQPQALTMPPSSQTPSLITQLIERIRAAMGVLLKAAPAQVPPLLLPEQKRWAEQIETYAESPFEKQLFSLVKKGSEFPMSRAWAGGIKSPDPQVRDAAISLFRAYLAYSAMENTESLSPHTQMKLMIFSPHLNEGPLGKAILYEAILTLPIAQILEFSKALGKDFVQIPPIGQALILKQLIDRRKQLDSLERHLDEQVMADLKRLIKALVLQFYANKQESLAQVLAQQEKIRLGFLKYHPIEEAYRERCEDLERRYRLKLRQLKKRRSQKLAEIEEERQRRVELIYDNIEGSLLSGLSELEIELESVLAAV